MNKSRKLKKAERALAKAEKAAVRAAQVVAKANKKRERILARERLRHDAEVARKAKKRAAKQGSAKQGSAKQESAKQGSAKQVVQRAAESAERVVEDAIDKVADTAFGLATTPRTLTPVERAAATTTTTTTKTTTTTVAELRELAKAQGIAGYSKLTKAELLSALDKG